MKIVRSAAILLLIAYAPFNAQTGIYLNPLHFPSRVLNNISETGSIKGTVSDENGKPINGANVLLKEIRLGCATDLQGAYSFRNIKPGKYNIRISFIGYRTENKSINIEANRQTEFNVALTPEAFQIGGIEVIGNSNLLPDAPETKTIITSGEIEHYQASSLKDVLDLVPGIQKTAEPGLSAPALVGIRGKETDELVSVFNSFGALILLDGTPVSNNANMQFERMQSNETGGLETFDGIDLRTIPADNIEKIEVIRGLAPVRYGDVVSGIINVETKMGIAPTRLKLKDNPDTREGNLGGGYSLWGGSLNYNFNAAQSERNIRVTGDEYLRLTGQAVYSASLYNGKIDNNSKILLQKILDEGKPKNDLQRTENYNRGYIISFSNWGKFKPRDNIPVLDYNFYATMRRENTKASRMMTGLVILPSGDTAAAYMGKIETRGIEWTLGGNFEWNKVFNTGDFIHRFSAGANPQYNANTGEGVVFDTLLSYYGVESGKRPYSFDQVPGQFLASLYLEDKVTGNFLFDFTLQLGFRYEMYRPYDFNFSGLWGKGDIIKSHQGTFFNPRINLMVYLSDNSQFRLSFGNSSKTPQMSLVYPLPAVFPWRDPETKQNMYFRYDTDNPELKGVRETLYEISYDHRFSNFAGISLTSYYKLRINEPKAQDNPVFHVDSKNKLSYINEYSIYYNIGKKETKGIEFSITTARIKPLNMDFQITGSYNFVKMPSTGTNYIDHVDTSMNERPNYVVPNVPVDTMIGLIYPYKEFWYDDCQINYYIKYTFAPLGLWVTLRAEQMIFERDQTKDNYPIDLEHASESTIANYYYSRRIRTKPGKWLFNLSLSKSLFRGAEVSLYVNNFLNDPGTYRNNVNSYSGQDVARNPELYYGIEFSLIMEKLL